MSEKDEQNYEDFLSKIINTESTTATPLPNRAIQMENRAPVVVTEPAKTTANPLVERRITAPNVNEVKKVYSDDMYDYLNMEELPLFAFYQTGTKIKFRDLKVKEIEEYSALDESNLFDFKEKLHDVLERACIFIHPDGTLGSYADILEGDKAWIIYTIREKTFPNGRVLSVTVEDRDEAGERVQHTVEIRRENIEIYRDEEIMQWYNAENKCLVFDTTLRDEPFYIAPPTVGLKNCFDQYLKIKREDKEAEINGSFFKYAPYLQPHVTEMSYEELVEFEDWFTQRMTPTEYSFLHDIFENYLYVGVRGLKKKVGTKLIRTNTIYPYSPKSIFVLPDAFRLFCK